MTEPNTDATRLALAALRVQKGLTLDELSGLAGIPRSVLTDIEAGRSTGSVRSWYALATALNVQVGNLLNHLHDTVETTPGQ